MGAPDHLINERIKPETVNKEALFHAPAADDVTCRLPITMALSCLQMCRLSECAACSVFDGSAV